MNSEMTHIITFPVNLSENQLKEMISINIICRLCANQCDKLIGIYSEDGISYDLAEKVNLYLPIKVSESDNLPLQCCWQCASTVLAWHDLVVTSVEADKRLKSCQFVIEKHDINDDGTYVISESSLVDNKEGFKTIDDSVPNKESLSIQTLSNTDLIVNSLGPNIEDSGVPDENTEAVALLQTSESSSTVNESNTLICKEEDSTTIQCDTLGEEGYNFECSLCPTIFSSEADIRQHFEEAHSDDIREGLFEQSDLEENEVVEDKINDKEDTKTKTNVKKKSPNRRRFHVRHMLKKPLPKISQEEVNKAKVTVEGKVFYKCKECGKCLHSMYTYIWHIRIHTGERPYVCDLCGKQFRVSQGLVRHLKETHEQIKNFDCDICGRFFATKRNVEEHRRIHTNERPYVCATCGKSFKQKASLFVHNRSHSTEFPFACNQCVQKFRTKQTLLTHMTKHTGEKPYACDVCQRHFRIKYELKRHKLVHSDSKPFICLMCSQAFRQKRYLRNHLKLNHHVQNPSELLQKCIDAM